jgi:Fe-S cluster biogenesis protein NfuA
VGPLAVAAHADIHRTIAPSPPKPRTCGQGEGEEFFANDDAETVGTIKNLIETHVRPAVASDGGDIKFRGFRDGIVYLAMKGSCSGCPSSTATLRHGIENLLKHYIPDVRSVEQI